MTVSEIQHKSSKASPHKVTAKEAYAQMIASAGNMGGKGSVLPAFAYGRKTPGAPYIIQKGTR
jgi:hypothetical protein